MKESKTTRADERMDKALGIKENGRRDQKIDRAVGLPARTPVKKGRK